MTLEQIEAELRVSRRTAERMLGALREAFPQIDYREEGGGDQKRWWFLPQSALRGVLSVDLDELAELALAARLHRDQGAEERAERLERLAGKLRVMMRAEEQRRVDPDLAALMEAEGIARRPGPKAHLAPEMLKILRQALLACTQIEFEYGARGAKQQRLRRVNPLGILRGFRPYLVASMLGTKGDPTLFRLDRIQTLRDLGAGFQRPSDFDLQAFANRSFGVFQEKPVAVRLRFSEAVAEEAGGFIFHPTQTMKNLGDGTLEVRFTAGGRREMFFHFVTWGEELTVVTPAALRREFAAWLAGLHKHHSRE